MSCPFEIDVVRWVTGDTRLNELERVEQHVAGCAGCRAKADALRAVLSRISQSPLPGTGGESSPKVFVESVMEKISRDRIARRRSPAVRRFALVAGFVLPIALFGGWRAYRMNRGGAALGVAAAGRSAVTPIGCDLLVLRDGRTLAVSDAPVRTTDQLLVKCENRGGRPMHAVVAALDDAGHVQKLYPSEGQGGVLLAARSSGQLGDRPASMTGLERGPLRAYAIVVDESRDAETVEASLRAHPLADPASELFPHAIVREWRLSLE